jgi:monoamine oxidase
MDITRRDVGALLAGGLIAAAPAVSRAAGAAKPLDVIVLGAGMSGLNAAWLLEQQGQRVMVLEGRGRVGGRVHTLFDQPGVPEMGFNAMAAGYGRGIDAAKRAGVELYDIGPRMAKTNLTLALGGKIMTRAEWAASPANPFPAARKAMMPWEISGAIMHQNNPLKDWMKWTDPANAALDVSLHDFLKGQGLSDAAIRLAVDTSPYYGGSAYDVSALMSEFADGWTKAQITLGM